MSHRTWSKREKRIYVCLSLFRKKKKNERIIHEKWERIEEENCIDTLSLFTSSLSLSLFMYVHTFVLFLSSATSILVKNKRCPISLVQLVSSMRNNDWWVWMTVKVWNQWSLQCLMLEHRLIFPWSSSAKTSSPFEMMMMMT